MTKYFKLLPKWRNFAKSGHTALSPSGFVCAFYYVAQVQIVSTPSARFFGNYLFHSFNCYYNYLNCKLEM